MSRPTTYVDPAGLRHDISNPNFEGFLTKQSAWLKDWRKRLVQCKNQLHWRIISDFHFFFLYRYFILKGSKLYFSKSQSAIPHGVIDLSQCMTVKSAELKAGKKNAIEVSTLDTTFFMFADTEKEKDDWIGAIGRSIVQASATFTNEDGKDAGNDSDSSNSDEN